MLSYQLAVFGSITIYLLFSFSIKCSESNMSGGELYIASEMGDLTEVRRLLDSGADVNWGNSHMVWNILYYIIQ